MKSSDRRTQQVPDTLESLGLDASIFTLTIRQGEAARRACTKHDPRNARGQRAYMQMVRTLRDQLVKQGWKAVCLGGMELVVNEETGVAIVPCRGDAQVGRLNGFPQVVESRGPVIISSVESNFEQMVLSSMDTFVKPTKQATPMPYKIWFLLHHRTRTEIRSELSFPGPLSEDGYVNVWLSRITLDPVSLDASGDFSRFEEEPELLPEVKPLAEGE